MHGVCSFNQGGQKRATLGWQAKAWRWGGPGRGLKGREGTAGHGSSLDREAFVSTALLRLREESHCLLANPLWWLCWNRPGGWGPGQEALWEPCTKEGWHLAWGAEEVVNIAGLQVQAVRTHTLAAGAQTEGVWPTKPAPGNTQQSGEAKGSARDIVSVCSSHLSSYKDHSNEVGTGSNTCGSTRRCSWYRWSQLPRRAEPQRWREEWKVIF